MIDDTFQTPRLRAERLNETHYDDLRVFHQDPQMMAMIGGLRDVAGTVSYLDRHLLQWHRHGFGFFLLRDGATGAAAGTAGMRWLKLGDDNELEVGYGFLPAYWGRGLGTEIAGACVSLAFERLLVPSVVALTNHANTGSQRVLGKVGLHFERDVETENRMFMLYRGRSATRITPNGATA